MAGKRIRFFPCAYCSLLLPDKMVKIDFLLKGTVNVPNDLLLMLFLMLASLHRFYRLGSTGYIVTVTGFENSMNMNKAGSVKLIPALFVIGFTMVVSIRGLKKITIAVKMLLTVRVSTRIEPSQEFNRKLNEVCKDASMNVLALLIFTLFLLCVDGMFFLTAFTALCTFTLGYNAINCDGEFDWITLNIGYLQWIEHTMEPFLFDRFISCKLTVIDIFE
ncbi:unnamed protein product [Orchesella dallaii]|uniref:Uncharacterized protein n=1 Tax=Orchesella dallaii TaxID=48710 RepID=A0ABP1RQY2_9HEXA